MSICQWCKVNEVSINKKGKPLSFCSKDCRTSFSIDKRKKTNIQKYGTENPMLLDTIKKKRDLTNLNRYGTTNPFTLPEIQQRHTDTCLQKYGVKHSSQLESVKRKQRLAWSKYENSHPFSDKNIRLKRENTLLDKYGVKHPILHPEIRKRIEETNQHLYGFTNATSSPVIGQRIADTRTAGSTHLLRDSNWLENRIGELGIRGVAEVLKVSARVVRQYANTHGIELPSKSTFEDDVCKAINELSPDIMLVRNSRTIINKEIDIYLPELSLAIECNGTYWHSEINGRSKNYHLDKTLECVKKQIRLVHIWEHDWLKNKELIVSRLGSLLGKNTKVFARNTVIKEIDSTTCRDFLRFNHIQGSCNSSIRYGLYKDEVLLAVMTFGKSRFSKTADYELIRFCSLRGNNIVGGAGKLFAHFLKTYPGSSVISYSDKSFNTGKLYEQLGFTYSHSSKPGYHYTDNYSDIYNRVRFQKHKLSNILENYDGTLTEWENMSNNGYDRIWDCGNDVWLWKPLN